MPIKTRNVMYKEYVKILKLQENHFLDLKAIEIKPAKLTQTISAFANADGGEVYLGIAEKTILENGRQEKQSFWEGFQKQEDANDFIRTIDNLFRTEQGCSFEFLFFPNKNLILHIEIPKTNSLIMASDQEVYLRRNAENKRQNEEGIRRILYDKGIESFENQTISNLEIEEITNSNIILNFLTENHIESEPVSWLKKQRLIRKNLPTVCGILLFSDLPQAIIPKNCGIKIYRYKTANSEGVRESLAFDPITIEGDIYGQIKFAVIKTREIVESVPRLGECGLEEINYPTETLHEIITNAVLHRDYSIADDIHIRIFDNRIEVESPGRLPGHITIKNILEERCSRNGNLVRIINKFPDPPNKDIGEGLNTAFRAMNMLGLKPPKIEQKSNSFIVYIRHEPLASAEEIILDYLNKHEQMNVSVIKTLCYFKSDYDYKKIIRGLVKRDLISHIPNAKGKKSAYRKVKPLDVTINV
ncbi:ATP-binding protein [Nostoc sp. FACHB-133]|uniref:ATP-binding protein n=1 Tax=Nostoc sp. FACHB-133 TaxID=2692835 RepID=UPI001686CCDF|nr:ATP-binding protein [Nostoc sp. FACHB-133]MBD2527568.1 putative DNA binding domain-containing protein [Nostoc sp. FACHB-133]